MLLVPNDISSTISIDPDKFYYEIGSNVTLSCSINHQKSSYIDVDSTLYVEWNYKNYTKITDILLDRDVRHSLEYTIYWLKLSDAGQYYCLHYITATVGDSNIISSSIINKTASIRANSKSLIKINVIDC